MMRDSVCGITIETLSINRILMLIFFFEWVVWATMVHKKSLYYSRWAIIEFPLFSIMHNTKPDNSALLDRYIMVLCYKYNHFRLS